MPSMVEELVHAVWADVLGIPAKHGDDFFAIGGDSLGAARCCNRLSEVIGVPIPSMLIFEYPELAEFAVQVMELTRGARGPGGRLIHPRPATAQLALTEVQEYSLKWLRSQQAGGRTIPPNVIVVPIRARAAVDDERIRAALDRLMRRHEALRTGFRFSGPDGGPEAFIEPNGMVKLDVLPVKDASIGSPDVTASAEELMGMRLPLERPPLFAARILRAAQDDAMVLIGIDHYVFDGESANILFEEFADLLADPEAALPPVRQMADWAAWQRGYLAGPAAWRLHDFWRRCLDGIGPLPPLGIPMETDADRPGVRTHITKVGPVTSPALRRYAQNQTVTPFMVVLNAVARACAQVLGLHRLVIHTPYANRWSADAERVVGALAHSMLVSLSVLPGSDFRDTLEHTRRAVLEAMMHNDIPLPILLKRLESGREVAGRRGRLFFSFQNANPIRRPLMEGVAELHYVPANHATNSVDSNGVTIVVHELGDDLTVRLITASNVVSWVPERLADRIVAELATLTD